MGIAQGEREDGESTFCVLVGGDSSETMWDSTISQWVPRREARQRVVDGGEAAGNERGCGGGTRARRDPKRVEQRTGIWRRVKAVHVTEMLDAFF
jgi:hypothetical protein